MENQLVDGEIGFGDRGFYGIVSSVYQGGIANGRQGFYKTI